MSSDASEDGAAANQLKLTGLIDDCLERIFLHLSLVDLLAIADTNKQLKQAADMVFSHRFGKKVIHIHIGISRSQCPFHKEPLVVDEKYIKIFQWKISLQLLRCYGHLISKLHIYTTQAISNRNYNREVDWMLRYTMEYCPDSLVILSLYRISTGTFDSLITKPFSKLQSIGIVHCDLGVKKKNFNAWFPALRRLDLINNRFFEWASIEKHFPHLGHLGIIHDDRIPTKSILAALRLNPQLRSFTLTYAFSPDIFRYASKCLPHFIILKLSGEPMDFSAFRGDSIHFKTVKKLELAFIRKLDQTVGNIKLSFDQLEEVKLNLDAYAWTSGLNDFLKKHQSIKKVTLRSKNAPARGRVHNEIMEMLPQLRELSFATNFLLVKQNGLTTNFDVENFFQIDNMRLSDEGKVTLIVSRLSFGNCDDIELIEIE